MIWAPVSMATIPFRVQKNAASLKRIDFVRWAIGTISFPRSKERGFIEAVSASLEPSPVGNFPRSKERGFIEAELGATDLTSILPFRVQKNAASLKLNKRVQSKSQKLTFRVQKNAASLKRFSGAGG